MKAASEISTSHITPEMIGRAHKVFEGSIAFYKVSSSRDETVEYAVRWSKEHGFTCECESGQRGFANCKAGVCQHVIIAVAASREEKEAVSELHRLIAEQAVQAPSVDLATRARIEANNERQAGKPASKARAYVPAAFSILK